MKAIGIKGDKVGEQKKFVKSFLSLYNDPPEDILSLDDLEKISFKRVALLKNLERR